MYYTTLKMCETLEVLPKELSSFKDMGKLLKCGICYEYLKTALVTPCSHNYCSYCIRKSLLYKTQCPTCFEETTEVQLRKNRVLDDLISIFSDLGDKLLKYLANRCVNQTLPSPSTDTVNRTKPVSQAFEWKPSTSFAQEQTPVKNLDVNITPKKKVTIPTLFSPKKQGKQQQLESVPTVTCPVCSVDVPERNINLHLDACLKRSEAVAAEMRRKEQKPKLKPMPKLVYTLLNDKSLKKKLNEHGLSTAGDRTTLINRHRRFTVLYNSECDSVNPRPVSKLIQQIEAEEREEKKLSIESPQKRLNVDRNSDPKVIQAAQNQYLKEHKASFDSLIQSMRKRGPKVNLMDRVTENKDEDDPEVISIKTDSNDSNQSSEPVLVEPGTSYERADDWDELQEQNSVLPVLNTSESESSDNPNVTSIKSDTNTRSRRPVLNMSEPVQLQGSSEDVDDPEVTFIEGGSKDECQERNSISPVLHTRGKRKEVHNLSSTPDMFDGAEDSDDSSASISLMVYHTQESQLTGMPPSTYAPVDSEPSLNGMPPSTYRPGPVVEEGESPSVQEEAKESDVQPVNFDFDIDSLLASSESEAVLPTRTRSKRRGSVVSTSSEEVSNQRVLRKRVKR